MALLDVLHWLGVPGSIVLVLSTVWSLWHAHEIAQWLGNATIYARFIGLAILFGVLAMSGLIPGIHFKINLGALADALRAIWGLLPVENILP